MAKKKLDNEKIIVKDGDYFSATYNRKKIRGIVKNHGSENYPALVLYNSTVGEDTDCNDDDELRFLFSIHLSLDEKGTEEELYNAGVTNYVVLRDKRQKAIVDKDKFPVLETNNGDWAVNVEGNKFIFGCGNVELTKNEIEGYLKYRKIVPDGLDYIRTIGMEDCSIEEIEKYLKYLMDGRKSTIQKHKTLYDYVIDAVSNHISEDDVNNIGEAEIKKLFAYMDWINKKN